MKKFYLLALLCFYNYLSFAQSSTTKYDVKYYRIELRLNPDTSIGKYVRGKVTTYFTTVAANFKVASFDMASPLLCDSVYYHGVKLAAGKIVRVSDSVQITLPTIAAANTLDSLSIFYQGVPPTVPGFSNGTGFVKAKHNSNADNYIYTLSEPYSSYTWWPCKSFVIADKADSMDMIISSPTGFRSASNGTRVSENTVGSSVITYWKERYPISSYQVCAAVANYDQYPVVADTVVMGSVHMPVYNLIFPETNTTASHTSLDRVPLMITTFNSLFGDYPFKKEKYGNYTFGFGGGMEHNTFSGESNTGVYTNAAYWDILAHELGHQWWGDNVSCASWEDIWLHESFADYSEVLCAEFAPSVSALAGQTGLSWRQMKKNIVVNNGNQARPVHVSDTSTILTIFTPAVYIYERGGMVISMMRTLLGDAKFFQALKNYQSDPTLKLGNAFTNDVKRHMEAVSGLDLSTFFNQWIYNTGYASYSGAQWNNSGKKIVLKISQAGTMSSALSHFDMPVTAWIHGGTNQDTSITVYDQGGILYYDNNGVLSNAGGSLVQYNLSFVPTKVTFDSLSQVTATGSFSKNTGLTLLAAKILSFNGNLSGNDAKLFWSIDNSYDYASFDVEKSVNGSSFTKISNLKSVDYPGKYNFSSTDFNISSGITYYRLKVNQKDGSSIYSTTIAIAKNTTDNGYSVLPNPAKDFTVITKQQNIVVTQVRIFNASGKEVKRILKPSFSNNNFKISVTGFSAGNYFVEITDSDNQRNTKEIFVIK